MSEILAMLQSLKYYVNNEHIPISLINMISDHTRITNNKLAILEEQVRELQASQSIRVTSENYERIFSEETFRKIGSKVNKKLNDEIDSQIIKNEHLKEELALVEEEKKQMVFDDISKNQKITELEDNVKDLVDYARKLEKFLGKKTQTNN